MNILISIGCDKYHSMNDLACAEADAKAIFDLLTNAGDPYSAEPSKLLLSPTLAQAREVLNMAFPLKSGCDCVTFFFAGHGEVVGGNFYLCMSDSEGDKLSTTAFSINSLFSVVNEFKPAQVNIVIDACRAGGSSFDLGTLVKPEITGSSASSSVAFLGACGVDQYAVENAGHGFLTVQLLRTLRGEVEVQRRAPFLDLLEVGAVVSPLVQVLRNDQRPLSWGLNLFGESRFAKNPFYSAQTSPQHFPLPDISPYSHFGTKIRERSGELWEIHRELPSDFNPRRLLNCLENILAEAKTPQEKVALVKGLGASLSSSATESEDLLAPWLCLSTSVVALLPHANEPDIQTYLPELLIGLFDGDQQLQVSILGSIKQDEHFLLSQYAIAGDLFYLPLRITRLLGWLGLDAIGRRLLGGSTVPSPIVRDLSEHLISQYGQSLTAVSDAQAAPLYIFLLACRLCGWDDLAKDALTAIYVSFCDRKGNMTRCDVPVGQAVRYVLSLTESLLTPRDWRPASPSHLLPVLLIWGETFGLTADWDLRALDRLSMNFFIPQDPRDFSKTVVEDGLNHVHQIGFGLWRIEEFIQHYNAAARKTHTAEAFKISPATQIQCLLSSFLFPDRIPYFVGEAAIASGLIS